MLRIGFIGAGGMAQALARGLIAAELSPAERIICSCPRSDVLLLDQMRRLGCRTTSNNGHVADDSRILILAVKPPVIPKVLKDVAEFITPQHLVISVAMGITTRQIEKALPPKSRVIRVMPNTPALVREGASVFSCGSNTLEEDAGTAHRIFESVGICDQIEENLLDAVTGLSGSGPAYMFMAIEALADGGVKMGIRRELAIKLAAQTLLGSAKMVLETGKHPGALKDDVCSPAGTSIQAVHQLEKIGFRSALITAVEAATIRSKETGGLF
ncbi:pyrroline-5-carboxylate reductase 2-like isoform X2 [Argiope bruennichi]|uniref:Pyrroline-5-carboxylate reductase n=1 Tax=Argiope bruennichi TaxID=94029 RepID=A0A8T0ERW2_ARGBR|nr:pyrroline-5-carboxylate reductase 2-like isoform X2 [Argiope bruennichi]KAF8778101.1 Pyrroline-5-carboxylate reductase 2 like protein [Argiope bruennichi]